MANDSASINQPESPPTLRKRNSKLPPGEQEIWKTTLETQQHRFNNKKVGSKKKVLNKATLNIKLRGKRVNSTNFSGSEKLQTSISGWTAIRYDANGMTGESPLKMGPDGGVHKMCSNSY